LHQDEEDKGWNKKIDGLCHAAQVDQGKVLAICVPSETFSPSICIVSKVCGWEGLVF